MSLELLRDALQRAEAQIGKRFTPKGKRVNEVTEFLARNWAYGLEEQDPVFSDPAAARAAGRQTIAVAPSLVYLVARGPSYEMYPFPSELVSLHGASEFDFFGDIEVGDKLEAVAWITEARETSSAKLGPLGIVKTTNEYRNQRDELVAVHRHTTVLYSIEEALKREAREPTATPS